MKPYHILNTGTGDVRSRRATLDEIREIVAGNARYNETLARVTVTADGEIEAVALNDAELKLLTVELETAWADSLVKALDLHLATIRASADIPGVSDPGRIIVWLENAAPATEKLVREWAQRAQLDVKDESPPTDGKKKRWIRTTSFQLKTSQWSTSDVVVLYWPEEDVAKSIAEIVAKDAEAEGRHVEAKAIRDNATSAEAF